MMKGSFYGLSTKQLTLFLAAVAFTTILLVGWAKAPIVSSLIPSQGAVFKLLPVVTDKEVKAKEASRGVNGSEGASPSVSIVAPVNSPNTISFTTTTEKENLTAVNESIQETTTKHKEDSYNEMQDSVAPLSSVTANSSLVGKEDVKTPPNNQETTTKHNEDSHKQTQDSVAPLSSVTANSSLIGKEYVKTPPKNQGCSYTIGKWIHDDNRPLYSGFGCKQWLSSMWACRLTQRTDFEYEKLRWQPKNCEMENFTGSKFLRRMQNKTIAFIGDSLGRQQFQSLMCMVTEGEERPDVLNVGWEYGLVKEKGHVRPDGWAYRFPSTNTTILYYWSASLCDLEPLNITNPFTDYAMHLDRPPSFLRRFLPRFDVLVLNTGHHWNRGKLEANRWIMHVGGKPNTNTNIADIAGAKNFTIYSIVKWLNSELPKYPGLKAFYRSISPRHFFNGDWNTGGTCDNTTPRSGDLQVLQDESIDPIAAGSVKGTRVKLLDVTAISQLRDEGHISRYSIKATPGMQDCLHWCLPGVPDTWNELLFAQI